jgi:hypothetical protein
MFYVVFKHYNMILGWRTLLKSQVWPGTAVPWGESEGVRECGSEGVVV